MKRIDIINMQIDEINKKITSCDRWSKFFRGLFKVIMYIHVGFSGTFAVNGLKDAFAGNLSGIMMFLGLLGSGLAFGGIGTLIQKSFINKKLKLENDLDILNKNKELLIKKENKKKSIYVHTNYNALSNGLDKEMKLTLRK